MSEKVPSFSKIDNSSTEIHPEGLRSSEVHVKFSTFEDAKGVKKKFSDDFIDRLLAESDGEIFGFTVGSEQVGLKGYLDKVAPTDEDEAIIDSPEHIAAVYLLTTEMIARNLKIKADKNLSEQHKHEISSAKSAYLQGLKDTATKAADSIVAWTEAGDQRIAPCPSEAFGYYGCTIGEGDIRIDILEQTSKHDNEFHSNIRMQRQGGANFIFAYSDARVSQRMEGKKPAPNQRIYLNPSILQAPDVFEKVLQSANEAGIPLEMKMLQRAEELGAAHIEKSRDVSKGVALRGDGIVLYVSEEYADDVLAMVLAVAQDNPIAF